LSPFYIADTEKGILTKEEAAEYLQELFLMVQASTPKESPHFTRGGESHFCIGGYGADGRDCFNEMSRLIAKSMVELPTYIPQVTLRWTKELDYKDFCYIMELERRDPHKRIAFTNDEKRIRAYTQICGIPFDRAVSYTMVGCNEPAFLGAITGSNSKGNILRCMETLFHKRRREIEGLPDFDSFYQVFERELYSDLEKIFEYDDLYNRERAKDFSYISSLFFNGCVENGKSLTQGGGDVVVASPMLIGVTNLIDSLITVKQFVYDEGAFTMGELADALVSDWQGHERMHALILKRGKFFGNDDPVSLNVSKRLYESLYKYYKNKKNDFGYPWLVGDLLGYNEHHKWFGERTRATPDGRRSGELIKFGLSQSEGRDREGLFALLKSIATVDENAIGCGATVTNIMLDKAMVENDESFEKLCKMLEEYFKMGGVHFQLTYVSRQDLLCAKAEPEKYKGLRVRVTGFSDYFVKLKESIQDDIIRRTEK
jgi:formate C-acetyltransferase